MLLCLLAAVHVCVFSAAFPFFNNVDEQIHFDLAVKWSQGHVPRALEPVSDEAVRYIVLYGSPEYVGIPTNSPDGQFAPPPWKQPLEKVRQALIAKTATWQDGDKLRSLAAAALLHAGGFVVALGKDVRISRRFFALLGPLPEFAFGRGACVAGLCGRPDDFSGKFVFAARRAGIGRAHAANRVLLDSK